MVERLKRMGRQYFWDAQMDYLKATRARMWNDDYFEFLVKSVWAMNSPKKIIDFGCGYGFLGMKLLPLLPQGTTYTGVDMGKELLKEAKRLFENAPYKTEFIHADLREYVPENKYDVAICQALLRHIPQGKQVLRKMVDAVSDNGTVICIEVNRRMENAGLYIEGTDYDIDKGDYELAEKWKAELLGGGRDYLQGIKTPIYMEQLGLKNVGVRVNDYVEFISPNHNNTHDERERFVESNQLERKIGDDEFYALQARCLLISYGTK